jgi:hypothetical protein
MERVRKKPVQPEFSLSVWNRIGQASFRKPCAWLTLLFIFGIVGYSLYHFGDVPSGTQAVLMALVAIPVAVVGSSSYEHKIDSQNGVNAGEEGNGYEESD